MVLAFCWRHLRGKAQHASDEPRAGAALFGRGREKGQDVEERCGVRTTIVDTYVARRQKSVLSHHQICREGWASQAGGRSEGSRGRESSAQGWGPEGGVFWQADRGRRPRFPCALVVNAKITQATRFAAAPPGSFGRALDPGLRTDGREQGR